MPCRVNGQVEHVEAKYENGHMVFYVSAALAVQALRLTPVEVISAVEGVPDLECAYRTLRSVKLAAENTVPVTLTEEVSLPEALDARMALLDWASAQVESV